MKIAFFGTGEFSKNIGERLIKDFSQDINIKLMVSQPDKAIGRKKVITKTPVKTLAEENNIKILQPTRLKPHPIPQGTLSPTQSGIHLDPPLIKGGDRTKEFYEILESLELDFIVVVAYGKIIPKEILEIPKYRCINIHGSILPNYRGASPIQESIKNGDHETGVTIMYMSEGMDEGDILKIEKVAIKESDTTQDIFKKFEKTGPKLLVNTLRQIIKGEIKGEKQKESLATYCSKISKIDGEINFTNQTAKKIYNKFRAYSTWPGIYTYYKGKKFSVEDCEPHPNPLLIGEGKENISPLSYKERGLGGEVGEVISLENKKIGVVCKEGILVLKQIKLEGKKSMDILSFINGNKDFLDYKF